MRRLRSATTRCARNICNSGKIILPRRASTSPTSNFSISTTPACITSRRCRTELPAASRSTICGERGRHTFSGIRISCSGRCWKPITATKRWKAAAFSSARVDHARRHARDEFGCDGLKWDWEITHDGRKAYGTLLHMKYQVHNNGSYANILWGYYEYTQDKAFLAEFLPILEGLATFFMNCIVEQQEDGYGIGYLVGVHESPTKVRNDGTNLAGTIAILRHYSDAAKILGYANEFSNHCAEVAVDLTKRVAHSITGASSRRRTSKTRST